MAVWCCCVLLLSGLQPLSAHADFFTSIGKTRRRSSQTLTAQRARGLVAMVNLSTSGFFHPGQMADLLYTEKDLVTSLKDYIKAEESKLERVKQ